MLSFKSSNNSKATEKIDLISIDSEASSDIDISKGSAKIAKKKPTQSHEISKYALKPQTHVLKSVVKYRRQ